MRIYCDHNASTPLRPEALEAMLPFLRSEYGNASSVHAFGSRARCAVEEARAHVAALIGAQPAEIVFTSGGTESNNLGIYGAARAGGCRRIVTTPIEHASVRAPLAALQAEGYAVAEIPVDAVGRPSPQEIVALLRGSPALLTIGWANNEVGTVQPIAEIATHCQEYETVFHVDAVQAVGKIPVDVCGIDLMSISAHKLGGPQGVGALFVRRGVNVHPLLRGGNQERGRRAGTENVAGIVGMGEACRLATQELGADSEACVALRDTLWKGLEAVVPGLRRNSPAGADCLPNTLHVSFHDVRGEALVAALDLAGVAISAGSACAAGAAEPSHVLIALGHDAATARDGVRFSFGWTNTVDDVEPIVAATAAAVQRIRLAHREERRCA
jgi:cysteine desulfurase